MPKINKSAFDNSIDSPLANAITTLGDKIIMSSEPILICGVNRKINIGNFENIDVYAGITLPLNISYEDKEELKKEIHDAATYAFSLMAKETGDRYMLIKDSQQG